MYFTISRIKFIFLLCIFAVFSMACEEEQETFRFCENEQKLALPAPCNFMSAACQRKVFEATLCANDSTMPMPPVRFITRDQLRVELENWYGDSEGNALSSDTDSQSNMDNVPDTSSELDSDSTAVADTDSNTASDTIEENPLSYWDETLRLLGLMTHHETIDEATIEEMANGIAAYYDSDYRDVTIIEDAYVTDPIMAMRLLAHEFTHAIQDYELGLDEQVELFSNDEDIGIATLNAWEGEAEIRSDFAIAILMNDSINTQAFRTGYQLSIDWIKEEMSYMNTPYLYAKRVLHYATGPLYFYDTYRTEGLEGINELRNNFPTASVYWMSGYDAGHRDSLSLTKPLQCGAPPLPQSYEFKNQNTFGAAVLFALLVENSFATDPAWNQALQWRGDSIRIYQHATEPKIAIFWQIILADPLNAVALQASLEQKLPNALILRNRDELLIFSATEHELIPAWAASYDCTQTREQ